MNPLEKYRLSQDVFFSLQTKHTLQDIVKILHKYEINISPESIHTQGDIKEILANTSDTKIFSIARDLNIDINNYIYLNDNSKTKESQVYFNHRKNLFNVDAVISFTLALLVPKVVFLFLNWVRSTYKDVLGITSKLKEISINIEMAEEIGLYVLLGVLFYVLSTYGVEKYFLHRIKRKRLKKKLLTQDILNQIDKYPITQSLRYKLKNKYIFPNLKN